MEGGTDMKDYDRQPAFEKFIEGVNRLLADQKFREVLMEIDKEEEEAISLLAPDPAAFLRYRGVQIPQDFRLSVEEHSEAATTGTGTGKRTVCYCLEICWWRWCIRICICKIVTTAVIQ